MGVGRSSSAWPIAAAIDWFTCHSICAADILPQAARVAGCSLPSRFSSVVRVADVVKQCHKTPERSITCLVPEASSSFVRSPLSPGLVSSCCWLLRRRCVGAGAARHRRRHRRARRDRVRRDCRRAARGRRRRVDSVHHHPRQDDRSGARARRRHARRRVRADHRAAAAAHVDSMPTSASRHRHHGARRQHAVVPRRAPCTTRRPTDKNLNRVFPGKADGTLSERIAEAITREVIARATHVDRPSLRRRQRIAAAVLVLDHDRRSESRRSRPRHGARLRSRSHRRGRIAADRSGRVASICRTRRSRAASRRSRRRPAAWASVDDESIGLIERGVAGVLKHLGMRDDGPAPVATPVWIKQSEVLRAGHTGLFYPAVTKGPDGRRRARCIGHITDFHGTEGRRSARALRRASPVRDRDATDYQRRAGGDGREMTSALKSEVRRQKSVRGNFGQVFLLLTLPVPSYRSAWIEYGCSP